MKKRPPAPNRINGAYRVRLVTPAQTETSMQFTPARRKRGIEMRTNDRGGMPLGDPPRPRSRALAAGYGNSFRSFAAFSSPSRNFGCATAISLSARSRSDRPKRWAAPYSVTT